MSGTQQTATTWPDLITALLAGQDLSQEQARWAMDAVMAGETPPATLAGFLVALRAKGEMVDEVAGLAASMVAHAVPMAVEGPTVDIVGTGGDRARSVNISTMASIVMAASGARVVKHGNRAASSASGSADVLEALGIRLDQPPQRVAEVLDEVGITFCFAQVFHPSFRHAGVARKDLGIPTVFNILGPLTNPASTRAAAIGAADARLAPVMAGVLADRGTQALVFRSSDGMDELVAMGPATVWDVVEGTVTERTLDPIADLGMAPVSREDLRGGSAAQNAEVALSVLAGNPGPVRETVLLNAAAGLAADGLTPGTGPQDGTLADRLAAGYKVAADAIDSGAAQDVLERWRAATA